MRRVRYSAAATLGARIAGMKLERCEALPKSGIVMLSYSIPRGE